MTQSPVDEGDDLRRRLSRLDPAPAGSAVDPATSPRARRLLESTMETLDQTATPTVLAPVRGWRRPALIFAAAAAIAAVAVTTAVATGGHSSAKKAPTSLALSLPAGGPSMGMCLPFDVKVLRDMPVALSGTVTSVTPSQVTVKVDHWYKGGSADEVTIAVTDGQTVALDGVDFGQGKRYLITATNGTINGCGFSGLATADLEKSFNDAFGH